MSEIFALALPFFALILFGIAAPRFWHIDEAGLGWLNVFVIYFALPALIFNVISAAPFESLIDWPFVTATSAVTIVCFLGIMALSRMLFATDMKTAVLQGTAGSYGNVGYMGLPLAVAFFGPEAAIPAALIFCFDCAIQFILTAGLVAFAHADGDDSPLHVMIGRALGQVARHPFIISTVAGGLASWAHWQPGGALGTILHMLMNAAGPIALFALGVTVGLRRFSGVGRELPMLAISKTILQPALAWAVVGLVAGLNPVWLHVAVMMAALPTASNAFILASQYKAYVQGASTAVIVTTVMTALTIPVLVYAMKSGLIP